MTLAEGHNSRPPMRTTPFAYLMELRVRQRMSVGDVNYNAEIKITRPCPNLHNLLMAWTILRCSTHTGWVSHTMGLPFLLTPKPHQSKILRRRQSVVTYIPRWRGPGYASGGGPK